MLEVFVRREDAERFVEEVRADDPELAAKVRIEERELAAGELNWRLLRRQRRCRGRPRPRTRGKPEG
jgi:hypothetical protein